LIPRSFSFLSPRPKEKASLDPPLLLTPPSSFLSLNKHCISLLPVLLPDLYSQSPTASFVSFGTHRYHSHTSLTLYLASVPYLPPLARHIGSTSLVFPFLPLFLSPSFPLLYCMYPSDQPPRRYHIASFFYLLFTRIFSLYRISFSIAP
jgi:hypothetical protein